MQKATQLLSISIGISVLIIAATSEQWGKSHARQVAQGNVTSISDGETLKAIVGGKQERIRLAYIDCPGKDQPRGDAATSALRSAVKGQSVRLNIVDIDSYGRKVAEVYSGDKNINLSLVRTGKCYAHVKNAKDKQNYFEAEALALKERLGVHKNTNAINPGNGEG